jgi:hypothetical protein
VPSVPARIEPPVVQRQPQVQSSRDESLQLPRRVQRGSSDPLRRSPPPSVADKVERRTPIDDVDDRLKSFSERVSSFAKEASGLEESKRMITQLQEEVASLEKDGDVLLSPDDNNSEMDTTMDMTSKIISLSADQIKTSHFNTEPIEKAPARPLTLEEELERLDAMFINVSQVTKSLAIVVKEIENQAAAQDARSLRIFCTSESCRLLLWSRAIAKDKVVLLEESTSFDQDPTDIVVLAALSDCAYPEESQLLSMLRSGVEQFYFVSNLGNLHDKWSTMCKWFESNWKLSTMDVRQLEV